MSGFCCGLSTSASSPRGNPPLQPSLLQLFKTTVNAHRAAANGGSEPAAPLGSIAPTIQEWLLRCCVLRTAHVSLRCCCRRDKEPPGSWLVALRNTEQCLQKRNMGKCSPRVHAVSCFSCFALCGRCGSASSTVEAICLFGYLLETRLLQNLA